ncbi:carbamoyl-phosphate synthase large subunit [Fusibacter sp. JL298sf-3]
MPLDTSIKKVLIIGSGPIVIGQAAEFDYSGTQACAAIREEGIETVLVNSNPATIMTDEETADRVYIEPLTVESLVKIIEREKPCGILAGFGGQTALNLAMSLEAEGHLERLGTQLLGMKAATIKNAEDREAFRALMHRIEEPIPKSLIASTFEACEQFKAAVGLPLIIRPAYTLGGTGGGIAENDADYVRICKSGIDSSPIGQILIEQSIAGWKEIEYEVMRDADGNSMIVCNMENIDPVGVHTGDSVVVAPSQTLPDHAYQLLRDASLKIIDALGIEGGCNIQFGLHPNHKDYIVIEVNPRVSRSSALASKAAGYPIAKIASKIALGYRLHELKNYVTRESSACSEPALDYVVVKYPKFPFEKFKTSSRQLTTQMKATGEVMAIDRNFLHAFMKALLSTETALYSLRAPQLECLSDDALDCKIRSCDDDRLFAVIEGLRRSWGIERLYEMTQIDRWFLKRFEEWLSVEEQLKRGTSIETALKMGFTERDINELTGGVQAIPKEKRVYKMVDTCSGEYEAQTPYYYSSLGEENESVVSERKKIVVIGSGPIRIGQGIEFDYSCVHALKALKKEGIEALMINNNPETVSTDFDSADKLYFEALDPKYVEAVLELEKPEGVFVQFGGQTAINLANSIEKAGYKILGTQQDAIDLTENRERFRVFLEEKGIKAPEGTAVRTLEAALEAAETIGYPVVVRPSYVIGGQSMKVVDGAPALKQYFEATAFEGDVLIDAYIEGTEIEVDAICDGEDVLIPGIMEHVEKAGVHSGDSVCVYPTRTLSAAVKKALYEMTKTIAVGVNTLGLINIQYVLKDGALYVIEVNPRASRTVPIISKVTRTPMVDIAVSTILGKKLADLPYGVGVLPDKALVAVKVPVFSNEKLVGGDSFLSPEMKSTGEALGLDRDLDTAVYKGFLGAGYPMKRGGRLLVALNSHSKTPEALKVISTFEALGFDFVATLQTHAYLKAHGVASTLFTAEMIAGIDVALNMPTKGHDAQKIGFQIRQKMTLMKKPIFTALETADLYARALKLTDDRAKISPLCLQDVQL